MSDENLPRTTTERLLKVAEIIEATPERYDQAHWADLTGDEWDALGVEPWDVYPYDVQGINGECGGTCCIAGWAVRYTPDDVKLPLSWESAGAIALGLDHHLALRMFSHSLGEYLTAAAQKAAVVHLLRRLARVPDEERTMETVWGWADRDPLVAELFDF